MSLSRAEGPLRLLPIHFPTLCVFASYNGGIGIIRKTDRRFSPPNELELLEIIPYAETRDYLKKILSYYARYKNLYDTAGLNASELKARVGG